MLTGNKITLATVNSLKPGQTIRDAALKGFGVRYRKKRISYFVQTRINGRLQWIKIGHHGSPWTPESARKRAQEIIQDIDCGKDPRVKRSNPNHNLTFREVFDLFITARRPYIKPKTAYNYTLLANNHLAPYFKNQIFSTISRSDVTAMHSSMAKTPVTANQAVVLLKIVMNWALVENLRPYTVNPCYKVQTFKTKKRAQFLENTDVLRLAKAMRVAEQKRLCSREHIYLIMLLLFTGARRSEILSLKREYVKPDRGIAILPDSKTDEKVIHLSPQALAILDSVPQLDDNNPYYFTGRKPGTHLTSLTKPWNHIRRLAKLDRFRLHDFRHSFASFASDAGVAARTVGMLLGHGSIETTKIYIHLFNNRAKDAARTTTDNLETLMVEDLQTTSPVSAAPATRSNLQGHK